MKRIVLKPPTAQPSPVPAASAVAASSVVRVAPGATFSAAALDPQLPLSVLISRAQSLIAQQQRQQTSPDDSKNILAAAKRCLESVIADAPASTSTVPRLQMLVSQIDHTLLNLQQRRDGDGATDLPEGKRSSSSDNDSGSAASVVPVCSASTADEVHAAVHAGRLVIVADRAVWRDVIGTSDVAEWLEQQAEDPAASLFRRETQRPYCLTLASALLFVGNAMTVSSGTLMLRMNGVTEEQGGDDSNAKNNVNAKQTQISLGAVASIISRCLVAPMFPHPQQLQQQRQHLSCPEPSTALLCVLKTAAELASKLLPCDKQPASPVAAEEIPDAVRIVAAVYGRAVFQPAVLAEAMRPGFVVAASMVAEGGRVEDGTHLVRLLAKSPAWILRRIIVENILPAAAASSSSSSPSDTPHHHHPHHHEQSVTSLSASVIDKRAALPLLVGHLNSHHHHGVDASPRRRYTEKELEQMMAVFHFTVKRAALTALLLRPPAEDLAGIDTATLNAAFCSDADSELVTKLALDLGLQTVLRVAQQRPGWRCWMRNAVATAIRQPPAPRPATAKAKASNGVDDDDPASVSLARAKSLFRSVATAELAPQYRALATLLAGYNGHQESGTAATTASTSSWRDALALCARSIRGAPEFGQLAVDAAVDALHSGCKNGDDAMRHRLAPPIAALQRMVRHLTSNSSAMKLSPALAARMLQLGAATCQAQWHAALQLHDTILVNTSAASAAWSPRQQGAAASSSSTAASSSSSIIASEAYQATLTALVDAAAQRSQEAARIGRFSGFAMRSKWRKALAVFWQQQHGSDASAIAAVPAMRHVTAAVAYSALATGQWSRAMQIMAQREALLLMSFSSVQQQGQKDRDGAASQDERMRMLARVFFSPSTGVNATHLHSWRRVLLRKCAAPRSLIERLIPEDKARSATQTENYFRDGSAASPLAAQTEQAMERALIKELNQTKPRQDQPRRIPSLSPAAATPSTEHVLSVAYPAQAQAFFEKRAAAAPAASSTTAAPLSPLFDALRSVYRPSATAFAAAIAQQHERATARRERILRAGADVDALAGGGGSSNSGNSGGQVPFSAVLASAPPPSLLSDLAASWMHALDLFQDAWMSSERGSLPSSVYLGALRFCQAPFSPPLDVTRSVVNVAKRSPSFAVDARLAAALIRTAAAARLWSDVIECFFLLLDSSHGRALPNRASIAIVLTACKEIDSSCDAAMRDVKLYLEASLEDSFAALGDDVVTQVAWFRSATTTIVTMEVRCSDFGSLTHVSRCDISSSSAGNASPTALAAPSPRTTVNRATSVLRAATRTRRGSSV